MAKKSSLLQDRSLKPMTHDSWIFVPAGDLVRAMGDVARLAPTWWPFISKECGRAAATRGVLVGVIPRNEYLPLLKIAVSPERVFVDYNPEGLGGSKLELLCPQSRAQGYLDRAQEKASEASRLSKLLILEDARLNAEEAEITRRHELKTAHLFSFAVKYRVSRESLLDEDEHPTLIFQVLEKLRRGPPVPI